MSGNLALEMWERSSAQGIQDSSSYDLPLSEVEP